MKERKRMWVDPPQGWQFGFPKIYEPGVDGDLTAWLTKEGYPVDKQTHSEAFVRFWDVEDEQ